MTSDETDRRCCLPPGVIVAGCGREFRAILRLVREVSELTGGQIKNSSGIKKSQVYSLGYARPKLPRSRTQVEAYLASCRLDLTQAAAILKLWDELHAMRA
jgi:hypothetical protein